MLFTLAMSCQTIIACIVIIKWLINTSLTDIITSSTPYYHCNAWMLWRLLLCLYPWLIQSLSGSKCWAPNSAPLLPVGAKNAWRKNWEPFLRVWLEQRRRSEHQSRLVMPMPWASLWLFTLLSSPWAVAGWAAMNFPWVKVVTLKAFRLYLSTDPNINSDYNNMLNIMGNWLWKECQEDDLLNPLVATWPHTSSCYCLGW